MFLEGVYTCDQGPWGRRVALGHLARAWGVLSCAAGAPSKPGRLLFSLTPADLGSLLPQMSPPTCLRYLPRWAMGAVGRPAWRTAWQLSSSVLGAAARPGRCSPAAACVEQATDGHPYQRAHPPRVPPRR